MVEVVIDHNISRMSASQRSKNKHYMCAYFTQNTGTNVQIYTDNTKYIIVIVLSEYLLLDGW